MRRNTEYVNKYLKKARSSRTGVLNHNLAIEEDYQFNLERLGGETLLRKKYPELYKIIQNTQQESVEALSNPSAAIQPMMARTLSNSQYTFGMTDSMKIRNIKYDANTTLETSSSMDMIDEQPTLIMMGDLSDEANGKALDGFAVFANNSYDLMSEVIVNSNTLINSTDRLFKAATTFSTIQFDQNGNPYFASATEVSKAVKVLKTNVVKKIDIIDPMPVKNPGAAITNIFYNREGIVDGADYYFADVKFPTASLEQQVEIHIPFKGSIQFDPSFVPKWEEIDKNTFRMELENLANGVCAFNKENWDAIVWKRKNENGAEDANGNILEFEFPVRWRTVLPTKKLNNISKIDIYCEFNVPVYMKFGTTLVKYGDPIQIVIQSDGSNSNDGSFKKINPIRLWWGCYARGTMIKMADNSRKAIEEINLGDEVLTVDGDAVAVQDLISGQEEKVVYIETSTGSKIEVSEDHPMMTTEGMILARDLNPGHIMVMEYGDDVIEGLYYKEYNDKVFNLALEKESTIIAEDFYSGDFDSQQRALNSKAVVSTPKKLEPFQEEIAELFRTMNRE